MLAILGLLGVALSAAVFVDFGTPSSDDDDTQPDEEEVKMTSVSDLLSEGGQALPGADAVDHGDNAGPKDQMNYTNDAQTIPAETAKADVLPADRAGLDLVGNASQNEIAGGIGDDFIRGEAGDDFLYGNAGDDALFGGAGNDVANGGSGNDWIRGGDGDDRISGGLGDDMLTGGDGSDTLSGGQGDDLLDGRADHIIDFLRGGAGDDTLIAGDNDQLNGGLGADTFSIQESAGAMIEDFDPKEDLIEIAYESEPPILTTVLGDAGLILLADGEAVATLGGVSALDVSTVRLVAL